MIGSSLGPSMGGKWRRALQSKPLLLVLLGGTCLSPVGAAAQTTNWLGASGTYKEPSNWSGGSIPSATDTAIFAAAPSTNVNGFSGGLEVGTWQFQAGAPAYTFTINSSFTFQGGGIVNNSSNAPTIVHGGASFITFANSATAGNANVTNNSFVEFDDTSTAGARVMRSASATLPASRPPDSMNGIFRSISLSSAQSKLLPSPPGRVASRGARPSNRSQSAIFS